MFKRGDCVLVVYLNSSCQKATGLRFNVVFNMSVLERDIIGQKLSCICKGQIQILVS